MTDWVRWGYDLGSSGFNAAETGSGNNISTDLIVGGPHDGEPKIAAITLLGQSATLDGNVRSQVLVVGSYAYVTTMGGTFYKLDATTLATVGTYGIGTGSVSTPHIIGGVAYFGDDDGWLHAVNTTTMASVWISDVQDTAPITSSPVVSGTRVFYGGVLLHAALIADGSEDWVGTGVLGPWKGPLAVWSGNVYAAGGAGVVEFGLTTGTVGTAYGALGQCCGVAIQTHPNAVDYLCFESEDHWVYAYDRATGERLWMEDHQGGDMKCPVGLDLTRVGLYGTGFAVVGTHNWSIQPHTAEGGDMIWKRDATGGSAVTAGFALANGIMAGVWPPNDGRVAAWILDDLRGGHVPEWKYGTSTGLDGAANSANKFNLSPPSIVNGRIYCGADNATVYCFA